MLKNYFKTAIRNLFRNKAFSFVNILGLAAGMAICMLIISMIYELKSYDDFHADKDRVYRVVCDRTSRNSSSFATAPLVLYEALAEQSPAIEQGLRMKASFSGDAGYGELVLPISGLYAEPSFFDLFDLELEYGDPAEALKAPYSIILTRDLARRFGLEGRNPVGEALEIPNLGSFMITGVAKEFPGKSHLQFEALVSFATVRPLEQDGRITSSLDSWTFTDNGFVYLKLKENARSADLQPLLDEISEARYAAMDNYRLDFRLQKLTAITPAALLENDISFSLPKVAVWFLSALALIVLLTACFNYTNLSVARALTRAKEVGVRKVVGARRIHVVIQFICEASLIALLALGIAWIMLEVFIAPQFQNLSFNQFLEIELGNNFGLYAYFFVFSLLVGLLAGILPAVYLSKFEPVRVLKSLSSLKIFSGLGWRKVLLVTQFVVSLVLLITVTVLYQQTNYMLQADYGFDRENIINLSLQGADYETLKAEFIKHPDILDISACSVIPGIGSNMATSIKRANSGQKDMQTHQIFVDENFVDNLNLEILYGSSPASKGEASAGRLLLNETGARMLGWQDPREALGASVVLEASFNEGQAAEVVGIIKDFPYMGVLREPESLVLRYNPDALNHANLRVQTSDLPALLAFIDDQWKALDPVHPVQYTFFDEQVATAVSVFEDLMKMLGFLAIIAIIITCLGLLGVSAYSVETRTKEIGIRKVLGANVSRIIWTLSKGLFYPLLIAVVLALPLAWFANDLFLQGIAYRISLNPFNLGLGVALILLAGSLILASQALRIARRNPVEALKYE